MFSSRFHRYAIALVGASALDLVTRWGSFLVRGGFNTYVPFCRLFLHVRSLHPRRPSLGGSWQTTNFWGLVGGSSTILPTSYLDRGREMG